MSMKNSNDTIENRTRDLVAKCLNQLRYLVPPLFVISNINSFVHL